MTWYRDLLLLYKIEIVMKLQSELHIELVGGGAGLGLGQSRDGIWKPQSKNEEES